MYSAYRWVQERRNSITNALELPLPWTNPTIWRNISHTCCVCVQGSFCMCAGIILCERSADERLMGGGAYTNWSLCVYVTSACMCKIFFAHAGVYMYTSYSSNLLYHYLNKCVIIYVFPETVSSMGTFWNNRGYYGIIMNPHCGDYVVYCFWCFICAKPVFNSLWPGDAIWRHGTMSTLAQVMACCLTAPSHYLNQCWLIIGEVPWHSSQGIILRQCEDTNR